MYQGEIQVGHVYSVSPPRQVRWGQGLVWDDIEVVGVKGTKIQYISPSQQSRQSDPSTMGESVFRKKVFEDITDRLPALDWRRVVNPR